MPEKQEARKYLKRKGREESYYGSGPPLCEVSSEFGGLGWVMRLHLEDAIDRAYSHTGSLFMVADAVHASRLIDDIEAVAGGDGADRAFGFASAAVGALFSDTMCHGFSGLM
jgi:hypothetical protein